MARILIIEDSPTDTAVLTQLLERHGHEVPAASTS
jgi:twitching motility two-component system response regulator PilH